MDKYRKEEIINLLFGILKFIAACISLYLIWMAGVWIVSNDSIFKYIILPFLWAFIFMLCISLVGAVAEVSEKFLKWYKELESTWWMNLIVIYVFGWLLIYIIYFQIFPDSW